jgi:AraC family transcriptional regulator, transcriptional activator of the genes for pyochelin and ferripyochelin receptors
MLPWVGLQNGEIASKLNEFETICEYPLQLAQGYRQSIQLRPGLELSIDRHLNLEHLLRTISECQWPIGSFFHLSGSYNCDCGAHVSSGHHSLTGSCVAPKETLEYLAGEQFVSVYIRMEPLLFRELVAGQLEHLPPALEPIVEEKNELIQFPGTITPLMQIAVPVVFCEPVILTAFTTLKRF